MAIPAGLRMDVMGVEMDVEMGVEMDVELDPGLAGQAAACFIPEDRVTHPGAKAHGFPARFEACTGDGESRPGIATGALPEER